MVALIRPQDPFLTPVEYLSYLSLLNNALLFIWDADQRLPTSSINPFLPGQLFAVVGMVVGWTVDV